MLRYICGSRCLIFMLVYLSLKFKLACGTSFLGGINQDMLTYKT